MRALTARRRYSLRDSAIAAAFLAPSLVVFGMFAFWPFVRILNWGAYEARQSGAYYESVGLRQYWDVLTGPLFRDVLWHTVQFLLYTVPAGLILGVVMAVIADNKLRGIRFYQTVFASTIATGGAVATVVFYFLINESVGLLRVSWLNDPDLVMFGVSLPAIWANLGLSFVIVLAGLQSIPDEIVEAARLDGYGPLRRLFKVTLPLISPVLMFLMVALLIGGMQAFAEVDMLTHGGPNGASETLLYRIVIDNRDVSIGRGSVLAVGLFVITGIVAFANFVMLDRRVHYG